MSVTRVLLVDDSATARAALRIALLDDPTFEVVGEAADGATAARLVPELSPDLVTMDVFLRAENGIDVTATIMATKATPIVIVTAADPRDPKLVFRAMKAGALDVTSKLPSPSHPDYPARRARLLRTLKTLSTVPVVHRSRARPADLARPIARAPVATAPSEHEGLLLLGASTGGPVVLGRLLRALPKPFGMPIAIVQHIAPGFGAGFATWLASDTGHRVEVVDAPRALERGCVYVASDRRHLRLAPRLGIEPSDAPPRGYHQPSIDVLFESAVEHADARSCIAVLFSGMGSDGALGLRALRSAGARTIAQLPSTCAVSSMPARAIELGAAECVLAPEAIPLAIAELSSARW